MLLYDVFLTAALRNRRYLRDLSSDIAVLRCVFDGCCAQNVVKHEHSSGLRGVHHALRGVIKKNIQTQIKKLILGPVAPGDLISFHMR